MEENPIVLKQLFNCSPARLWKALTDKEEMKSWYFELEEFRAEKGFRFQFSGGPSPEKQYVHLCEVTEVVPEKKLSHSWRYEGFPGCSYVSFELLPQGTGTLLTFTHTGLDTFPADNSDFARHNFVEGWESIIHTSLKDHLEPKE